jgi:hypothetical protein
MDMTPQKKYYLKNKIKQQQKQKMNYKEKKFGLHPSETYFSIQYIQEGYNPFIHCLGKKIMN